MSDAIVSRPQVKVIEFSNDKTCKVIIERLEAEIKKCEKTIDSIIAEKDRIPFFFGFEKKAMDKLDHKMDAVISRQRAYEEMKNDIDKLCNYGIGRVDVASVLDYELREQAMKEFMEKTETIKK